MVFLPFELHRLDGRELLVDLDLSFEVSVSIGASSGCLRSARRVLSNKCIACNQGIATTVVAS